jgi:protein TonB
MNKKRLVRLMPVFGVAVVALFTAAAVYAIKSFLTDAGPAQKKIVQVTLIQPPPPPPKIEQPPPEVKEEVKIEEPQQTPDEPAPVDDAPPGDQLGLDADGAGGADGFGLIGKKGGRGFLEGGLSAWYKGVVQQELKDLLYERIEQLKAARYSVKLRLHLEPDGSFRLLAIEGSTGDPQIDAALKRVLAQGRLREKPPENLAGLMRIQINSTI